MSNKQELFKQIPNVNLLLDKLSPMYPDDSLLLLKESVNIVLEKLRSSIKNGSLEAVPDADEIAALVRSEFQTKNLSSLRRVINGTGIVLHTNLGRACLSKKAAEAVYSVAGAFSTLEYDVENGERGSRHSHTEKIICDITGAEAAMVVNNNAGAVLLILSEFGKGGEVITSRGELVEIGGSFRIPEIMEACGCRLREVGSTNKTHVYDYERAVSPQTRALLKVHTSNFRIVGFSEEVSLSEMVELGKKYSLPVIQDIGSGSLVCLEQFGIHNEPTVQESIRAGVDIVSFSGDKLLGGAQAGIIAGKREYIERLKRNPLARALRIDKMTIAALRETLFSYYDPKRAAAEIPTLSMLSMTEEAMKEKADFLLKLLRSEGFSAKIVETEDQVGGGSVPGQLLKGYAVAISSLRMSPDEMETALRKRELPIIGRINRDRFLLSVRTLLPGDNEEILAALKDILGKHD